MRHDQRSTVDRYSNPSPVSAAVIQDLATARRYPQAAANICLFVLNDFHRPTRFFPASEAALQIEYWSHSHALQELSGKKRTPARGTMDDKGLVLRKNRLVVGALRVDPEFEHSPRCME